MNFREILDWSFLGIPQRRYKNGIVSGPKIGNLECLQRNNAPPFDKGALKVS
jgi:hypothetical protein